jgi:hypothetical protein
VTVLAGSDLQKIGAQLPDISGYLHRGSSSEGHHGNHGSNAYNYAQDGQRRAHEVSPDFPQGQ